MTTSYATSGDLTAWLAGGEYADDAPENPGRILQRASEVIDDWTFGSYERDSSTGLPVYPQLEGPLRDATCAQVEQWLEVGEENDIAAYDPHVLAPRARRILNRPVVIPADDNETDDVVVVLLNEQVGDAQPIGVTLV